MFIDPRDARIAELEAELALKDARIAELERQVAQLYELLHRRSHNSHLSFAERDGPAAAFGRELLDYTGSCSSTGTATAMAR